MDEQPRRSQEDPEDGEGIRSRRSETGEVEAHARHRSDSQEIEDGGSVGSAGKAPIEHRGEEGPEVEGHTRSR